MRILKLSLSLVVLVGVSTSCSRTKDNFFSRTYHRMTAKYNPLFNGEQAFLQGFTTLENGHIDNYDEMLAVYPFGSPEQAQAVVPQMDRAIEKSVKVVKEHSMSIGGEQKNPYVIDAYLLLAKAYFFKQDYFKALEGFNYVIQRYEKSDQALEAYIWAGRTNTRIGSEFAARNNFEMVQNNRDLRDRYIPHVSASMAELEISKKNWTAAATLLQEAIDARPEKKYRVRWQYILGQVYEKLELRHEASEAFGEVASAHPDNYEFYLNAVLSSALNFDIYQGNVFEVYEDLDDLAEDSKNEEYRDRIYYVKALLALESEDFLLAEESLKLSIRASIVNQDQKGLSYAELADINFTFKSYVKAQAYYDSAYQSMSPSNKRYEKVERFRESLGNLVKEIRIVELNDSLIRLAGMSPSQQRSLFEDYIARLKEEEERKAEQERNRALNQALAAELNAQGSGPTAGISGGGWYFYNQTTRTSGVRDFQQYWGRRELKDNWRRSASANIAAVTNNSGEEESEEGEENDGGRGETGPVGEERYNVEAYLAQIPKDEATIAAMHEENQDALLRMAGIYKDEIKDEQEAIKTYETLLRRYPEGKHNARALYALYLIFKNKGEEAKAQEYAQRLQNQHPSSTFAAQLNGQSPEENAELKAANAAYKTSYNHYLGGNYSAAKRTAQEGLSTYLATPLAPKFDLLLALSMAKTDGPEAYESQLKHVSETYSGTVEAERANELLMYIDNSSTAQTEAVQGPYSIDPKTPHRVLLIVPNGTGGMTQMRNEISDYNKNFNRFQNLQVQNIFLDRDRQLIVISGFIQQEDALTYTDRLLKHPSFTPLYSSEIMRIFAISDANYQTFYRVKDVDEYLTFYEQITGR
ncbi:type IX secretion system periplasmic lipoprotein PorW/SprE [Phaeocystidibacter luteus]|uniref:Tetratricopeptide repeat protein n=1 Tax=Phaeocystidibacter luteus TaxID=911197 RepID=A0A6N6RG17_9FLAO|nr:tetratricopeptide repeat protein [Phaeocystidibacter luteus]KAB2810121.1 tetratricopeptide repeat protein [Phaeocystidibacter luteus]